MKNMNANPSSGKMTQRAWLVTGSAGGLGRNIAEAVLASGDCLVATARDPRRLHDLVEKYGDQIRTAPLDVSDESAARASVKVAVDAFGRLDVVANHAQTKKRLHSPNLFRGRSPSPPRQRWLPCS